jgi:hypothetical protein
MVPALVERSGVGRPPQGEAGRRLADGPRCSVADLAGSRMGEGRTQIDSVEHSKHIFLLCVSRYATVILSDAFWRDSSQSVFREDWTFVVPPH